MKPIGAENFHVGEFIQDELDARGWTTKDLALRMGGDPAIDQLSVDMLIAVSDKNLLLDEETAQGLAIAFGVSKQYFLNLDCLCRRSQAVLK